MKVWYVNQAAVEIGGMKPGQRFPLDVTDGEPDDRYWRRRLAEGAIAPDQPTDEAPADEPAKKKGSK